MYEFVDGTGRDENATLRETDESWKRRKGREVRPTDTEQLGMRVGIQRLVEAGGMKFRKN